MNLHRLLPIAILALSANAHADPSKLEIIEQFDKLRMVSFVDVAEIDASPAWNPGAEAPPLSVDGAVRAVKAFIGESNTPLDVREIEIRRFPRHEEAWHYLIKIANDEKRTRYDINPATKYAAFRASRRPLNKARLAGNGRPLPRAATPCRGLLEAPNILISKDGPPRAARWTALPKLAVDGYSGALTPCHRAARGG